MKIEMWDIEKVKPYQQNPRDNDDAVDAVIASIREFGWRQPIVVDAEGVIIVGHTRYKAAQKMGLKQVPVHVATDLTPAQVKAYRIADSRLAHKRVHSGCYLFKGRWFKRCRRCRWYRSVDEEFYAYPGRNGVMGVCRRCCIDLAGEAKRRRKARERAEAAQSEAAVTHEKTPARAGVKGAA